MPWRLVIRIVGSSLLIAALTVTLLGVSVSTPAGRASCGSPLDVIADRTDWRTWYGMDRADSASGAAGGASLPRTQRCPDAINARIVVASVLAGAGTAVVVAAGVRRRRRVGDSSLRRVGVAVVVAGSVLFVLGAFGVLALVADGDAALFGYVGRETVGAIGLVLLTPVVALIGMGWAALAIAPSDDDRIDEGRGGRESS